MKLKITGYSNDAECIDYTFAEFEDGKGVLDQEPALSKAITWLDNLLDGTSNFSLLSKLNEMQVVCNRGKDPKPFPDKFAMPVCIVNLLIKEFGLRIEEA
jgi:hypothetical protein